LESVALSDPGQKQGIKQRSPVVDIRGVEVKGGQYYYYTPGGNGVRVVPCNSKDNIPKTFKLFINKRTTDRIVRLIVNVDADTHADGTPGAPTISRQSLIGLLKAIDPAMSVDEDGTIAIDQTTLLISLIHWRAEDATSPHLPNQQTLERLVCASVFAAYPERGGIVQNWLGSRTSDAPVAGVKEFALSHMAGWYADQGCDAFYRCLWSDAAIAIELKSRLQSSGALQLVQQLTT